MGFVDHSLDPSKSFVEQSVPNLTAQQIVDEINTIAGSGGAAPTGWLRTRWAEMSPTQQLTWVERRRAPLLIIWMRGGPEGFGGLREKLSEALELIDR